MTTKRRVQVSRTFTVALALSCMVLGAERASTDTPIVSTPVDPGGTIVYRDPATGRLRLTETQDVERVAAALRDRFGTGGEATLTAGPDGTRSVVVGPELLRFATVRIDPDGAIRRGCVAGVDAAVREALAEPAAAVVAAPADR